jgi:hypothetical protein
LERAWWGGEGGGSRRVCAPRPPAGRSRAARSRLVTCRALRDRVRRGTQPARCPAASRGPGAAARCAARRAGTGAQLRRTGGAGDAPRGRVVSPPCASARAVAPLRRRALSRSRTRCAHAAPVRRPRARLRTRVAAGPRLPRDSRLRSMSSPTCSRRLSMTPLHDASPLRLSMTPLHDASPLRLSITPLHYASPCPRLPVAPYGASRRVTARHGAARRVTARHGAHRSRRRPAPAPPPASAAARPTAGTRVSLGTLATHTLSLSVRVVSSRRRAAAARARVLASSGVLPHKVYKYKNMYILASSGVLPRASRRGPVTGVKGTQLCRPAVSLGGNGMRGVGALSLSLSVCISSSISLALSRSH